MIKKEKQLRRAIRIKRFRERHIYHIIPNYRKIKKDWNREKILLVLRRLC